MRRTAAALREAVLQLQAAGVPQAEWDAEALLRFASGWERAALLARGDEPLTPELEARFEELVAKRGRRIPLQHLIGRVSFWRQELRVSAAVLIPRPETEHLVETALRELGSRRSPCVVDVGTGSGCIAIAIACERRDATVHAIEISPTALEVARQNAREAGATNVRFHEGDLLAPVSGLPQRIDLVVSNPPYVDASEISLLAPEVRDHDPRIALVPPDGDRYSVYRRLAPQAQRALAPGGALMLEIGQGMHEAIVRLCEAAGLRLEATVADLQAVPRVIVLRQASA